MEIVWKKEKEKMGERLWEGGREKDQGKRKKGRKEWEFVIFEFVSEREREIDRKGRGGRDCVCSFKL